MARSYEIVADLCGSAPACDNRFVKKLTSFDASVLLAAAIAASPAFAAAPDAMGPPPAGPFTPREFAAAVRETNDKRTIRVVVGPATTALSLPLATFLLDHADMTAFIAKRRKIAPYTIVLRGPFRAEVDDGADTQGFVTLISATDRRRLYYAEGVHRSSVFPDIRADAVILMTTESELGAGSLAATKSTFEITVRARSRFVAGVVKLLKPYLRKVVDAKFRKAIAAADRLAAMIAKDPSGFVDDASDYPAILADDRETLRRLVSGLAPRNGRAGSGSAKIPP